jgi:hypothetical protein
MNNTDQSDLIAQALGGVVELGPDTARAIELGDAVSRYVGSRPAAARPSADPGVLETLRSMSAGVIRPGDILIVGAGDRLTMQQAHDLRETLLVKLPGIGDVVVLGGTVEGIYRGEPT